MIPSILLSALCASAPGGDPVSTQTASVSWFEGSFEQALEAAEKERKSVFLYCWSQESKSCGEFQERTMVDEASAAAMNEYFCVGANVAATEGRALIDHYGVKTLPTMLVIRPDGKADDAILGMIEPGNFVHEMQRIERGEGTVTALIAAVEELGRTKDIEAAIEARFGLLGKLGDVGRSEEAEATKQQIFKLDPKGKTLTGARVQMWDAMEACYAPLKAEGSNEETKPEFAGLEKFAGKLKHAELRFEAWAWLAEQHYHQGDAKASRAAAMQAWSDVPAEYTMTFGSQLSSVFYENREELSKNEQKFASSLAAKMRDGVDAQVALMSEKRSACTCKGDGACCGSDEDFLAMVREQRAHWLEAASQAFLAAGDTDAAESCKVLANAG
jgi:hypothetical protein